MIEHKQNTYTMIKQNKKTPNIGILPNESSEILCVHLIEEGQTEKKQEKIRRCFLKGAP